jgi:hypothetical protein
MLMVIEARDSRSAANQNATIEALARETDMPIAIVKEIYISQHTQLEQTARVKTYVPVLASSKVKHILNARKALNGRPPQSAVA